MGSHEKVAANLPTCIDSLSRTIHHQAPQGYTLKMCVGVAGSRGGNGLESRSESKWRSQLKSKEKKKGSVYLQLG